MFMKLRTQHQKFQDECKSFVDHEILPYANQMDEEEHTHKQLIQKVADKGYLGAVINKAYGGHELDFLSLGIMNEQIGRGCSSIRSLLTVHGMVTRAIDRWGTEEQKRKWLPELSTGAKIGAFGLSEPNVGTDVKSIETVAVRVNDRFVLNGKKKWITYGQIADLFLIFAQYDGEPVAFLVEKGRNGLSTHAINGMLGTKASMLAELHLENCEVEKENMIGGIGQGLSFIATHCLDYGRFSIAFGSVGIGQACIDESLAYTSRRKQFGVPLNEHQLIQKMLSEMVVNVEAARLLCLQLAYRYEMRDPEAMISGWKAKYFATTMLGKITSDAIQIQGANGCSKDSNVQRFFRDAKIMEIIEGTTQMHEIVISKHAFT
ncbi:hypothetical protein SAMN05428987_5055 [Paenibacillus sp. CF095]|uniref:acyl-CoA dehydrogenase family protein n=1 Tax=Paenibacillus sp. CF095 TaxID=1881033 RepID=UPI00088F489C|nr:acyl-CoA dehydrogenase family protein [Paenibacillus sp. CF095]SDD51015.1 hypothetical protein SAMN05428987_5055 [Paenibacillus sp. CF095]